MKKALAFCTAAVLLTFITPVYASGTSSPKAHTITEEAGEQSPKTGDMDILLVEAAGAAALVAAAGAYWHSRRLADEE